MIRMRSNYAMLASLAMHRLSLHNSGGADAAAAAAAAGSAEAAPAAASVASATADAAAAGAAAAAAGAATAGATAGATGAAAGTIAADAATIAAAEAAKAAAAGTTAPEKYELKLPDGSTLGADLVTRTADTARALGLSNEAGQKLLDAQIAEISKATATATEAAKAEQMKAMQPGGALWNETEAKWRTQSLADTEVGGSPEKLQASVDLATKVVNRFASDDAKTFFQQSGLGSHPELVRMFARIGKQMSEASLVLPGARASAASTEEERLAKRYPTMVAKS